MKRSMCVLFAVFGLALLFVGCMGEDGSDGPVYIRCTYDYSLVGWSFSNSSVRYTNASYQISPGTYSFSYHLEHGYTDEWNWGSVALTAYHGGKGGMFWQKGSDGSPHYYTLNFGWYEASLSKPGASSDGQKVEAGPAITCPTEGSRYVTRIDTVEGAIAEWKYQVFTETRRAP